MKRTIQHSLLPVALALTACGGQKSPPPAEAAEIEHAVDRAQAQAQAATEAKAAEPANDTAPTETR